MIMIQDNRLRACYGSRCGPDFGTKDNLEDSVFALCDCLYACLRQVLVTAANLDWQGIVQMGVQTPIVMPAGNW